MLLIVDGGQSADRMWSFASPDSLRGCPYAEHSFNEQPIIRPLISVTLMRYA